MKQESLFYWRKSPITDEMYPHLDGQAMQLTPIEKKYMPSAFTVAELGEILPVHINHSKSTATGLSIHIYKTLDNWKIGYIGSGVVEFEVFSHTEAEARAKMLIYLLENKLITLQ